MKIFTLNRFFAQRFFTCYFHEFSVKILAGFHSYTLNLSTENNFAHFLCYILSVYAQFRNFNCEQGFFVQKYSSFCLDVARMPWKFIHVEGFVYKIYSHNVGETTSVYETFCMRHVYQIVGCVCVCMCGGMKCACHIGRIDFS